MNTTDAPIAPKSKLASLLDRLLGEDERAQSHLAKFRAAKDELRQQVAAIGERLRDARAAFDFASVGRLAKDKANTDDNLAALGDEAEVLEAMDVVLHSPQNFRIVSEALTLRAAEAREVAAVRRLAMADAARDSISAGAHPLDLLNPATRGYAEFVIAKGNHESAESRVSELAAAASRTGIIASGVGAFRAAVRELEQAEARIAAISTNADDYGRVSPELDGARARVRSLAGSEIQPGESLAKFRALLETPLTPEAE